jgi:hypothetical protein
MSARKLLRRRLERAAERIRQELWADVWYGRPSFLGITVSRSILDANEPKHLLSLKPGERR